MKLRIKLRFLNYEVNLIVAKNAVKTRYSKKTYRYPISGCSLIILQSGSKKKKKEGKGESIVTL